MSYYPADSRGGCMESMSRCCRQAYVYPLDTRKLLYAGGAVVGVILVAVVWSSLSSGDSATPAEFKGSSILLTTPLIVGSNYFPTRLHNQPILNFTFDQTNDTDKVYKTDITKLKSGLVSSQIWSISVSCSAMYKDAVALTLEQVDSFSRLIEKYPSQLDLVLTSKVMKETYTARQTIGSVLSVSSGHSLDGRLAVLRTYRQLGVRVMALASDCPNLDNNTVPWAPSYLDNTTTGLSEFGKKVVREMNRLGIVIDLSQASHQTQLDVLTASKAPVIFSHAAAYGVLKEPRNIQDDVLDKLKINKGVLMVTFIQKYISSDPKNVTIDHVIDHINYIKNKIGVEYVGIGGEFDAQNQIYPTKLEDVSTFPSLFDQLGNTWTNHNDLKLLAGGNLLRVLQDVEQYATNPGLQVEESFVLQINSSCYSDFDSRVQTVSTTPVPATPTPTPTPTTPTTPVVNATTIITSTTMQAPNATTGTPSPTDKPKPEH